MAPPEGTPPPEALASWDISDEARDPPVIPEGVNPALRTFWSDMMPSTGENSSGAAGTSNSEAAQPLFLYFLQLTVKKRNYCHDKGE